MSEDMKKFKVTGMSCSACSARVDRAVSALRGVDECSVNLLLGTMQVRGNESVQSIIAAVRAAGYDASLDDVASEDAENRSDGELKKIILRLAISSVLLLVLMYFSMGHTMLSLPIPAFMSENIIIAALLQLALSLAVMVINSHFFISGVKGLIHLSPNMDTLVSLGSFASFAYSAVLVILMPSGDAMELYHGLYFESAAMILVLIGIGKMLEHIAKGRTTSAISALMDLSPKTALVKRGGEWVQISARMIERGDIFLARRGENIATDGVVLDGECSVDESGLTGESLPRDKDRGCKVYGGTTVLSGYAEIEATEVGEQTVISGIVRTVREAAGSKAPIAKFADKVSGVFVPVVMLIALITAAVWLILGEEVGFALARGVCVLVISCPCALGLATPVAIMVGSGVGARLGVLFKTAAALERAASVDVVAFDKTGTVTEGNPRVDEFISFGQQKHALVEKVCALERKSEHPLASALVEYALGEGACRKLSVSGIEQSFGGLAAEVDGKRFLGGNADFMKKQGISIFGTPLECYERMSACAKTVILFAEGAEIVGIAGISDRIKEDSRKAVEELSRMGISSVMISGDSEITARGVAAEVGIGKVIAGVFPERKAEEIKRLRESGAVVAMVGDGVNDAPALTVADVGIAIGRGTDIAIDSADIVLSGSTLLGVSDAIKLSRRTLRKIKQNLFWAFCYNIIGIPLAAGVFTPLLGWSLNPMFGAAAMSISSFLVVTNALLLNFFRPKRAEHTAESESDGRSDGGKADSARCAVNRENGKIIENGESSESGKDGKNGKNEDKSENIKGEEYMKITVKIDGMMCTHCSGRVKKAILSVDGVKDADVSHERGDAVIELSGDVSIDTIKRAVEDAGYTVI